MLFLTGFTLQLFDADMWLQHGVWALEALFLVAGIPIVWVLWRRDPKLLRRQVVIEEIEVTAILDTDEIREDV